MRRKHQLLAVLMLAAAAVIALVATARGGAHTQASGPSGVGTVGPMVGKGGGYGEVYRAPAGTLKHSLFSAKLLPASAAARNVALAGLGRSTRTVNYALALQC